MCFIKKRRSPVTVLHVLSWKLKICVLWDIKGQFSLDFT